MSADKMHCLTLEHAELAEVPITQEQYEDILSIQQEILGMMASHANYMDIFNRLCTLAEQLLPNSVASIMLLNKSTNLMSVLAAPSIPQVGQDALRNLKPGRGGGSCGNAVFSNEAQYVLNTFEDPRWEDLRNVAIDFNLCSCWSMPVRDTENEAIGTFALSSFEHRLPALFHKKLLETASYIVNIVLKNKENEQRLQLFSKASQNASEGMIITDENNKIIEVNSTFKKVYGYSENEVLGKNPSILSSKKHTKQFYKDMWKEINEHSQWSGDIINKNIHGDDVIQWMSVSSIKNENNKTKYYFAIFSDLTEIKKTQNKIKEMAYQDSLTMLKNKAYLETLLLENTNKTLILLNVNNFSLINSTYGFDIGDKLLKKIANILEENFTTEATCRINADEFALLFNEKIDIKEKVSEIQKCFYSQEITIDNIPINVSFSYGATFGSTHRLRNTALALKEAKENAKNSLYIYNHNEDVFNHAKREEFIEYNNILHNALNEDRVIPYFQGIYNNTTNKITKFESLVRIIKDGEAISPFKFLEPARLSGLLPEITKVMIDKSFKIMENNSYTFSINVTEDDLNQNYLLNFLNQKADEYKIEKNRVTLEILEGISAKGKGSNIKQLKKIKEQGYSIAIDDFGTEYSNFERVLELEIDYLKIDAKYIKDIHTNKKSYEITKAITYFAHNANIPCIAEFVHNEAVQKIIEELGIEYSQGYYFSEPYIKPISEY